MRALRWNGCLLLLAALLLPARALARPTIRVLSFGQAVRVRQAVVRLLRKRYDVSPLAGPGKGEERGGGATADRSPPSALVRGELIRKADRSGWVLFLSMLHGPSGRPVAELRYRTQRLPLRPADLLALSEELFPAVDKAIAGPPAPTPMEAAERASTRRPDRPLSSFLEADVGFILGMRRFSFEEEAPPSEVRCYNLTPPSPDRIPASDALRYAPLPRCPGFNLAAAPGFHLDLTLLPLAALSIAPLRGLGLGMTFDWMLWPASRSCGRAADGSCATLGEELTTREFRLEAGLRWRWALPAPWPTPTLTVQYGLHHFSIEPAQTTVYLPGPDGPSTAVTSADNQGLPDLTYQYLDLAVGLKAPYLTREHIRLGGELRVHYHLMLSQGDVAQTFADEGMLRGGYGPVRSSHGWRIMAAPAQLRWRAQQARVPGWLRLDLSGYVESFSMQFRLASGEEGNPLPPLRREPAQGARYLARSASDWYFGVILQAGYQF